MVLNNASFAEGITHALEHQVSSYALLKDGLNAPHLPAALRPG